MQQLQLQVNMMRKMENKLSKDEVIAAITDILVGVVGWIEKDKVLPTAHQKKLICLLS